MDLSAYAQRCLRLAIESNSEITIMIQCDLSTFSVTEDHKRGKLNLLSGTEVSEKGFQRRWCLVIGKILNFYLFIYLWLCWVFVSVRGLSLVVASGGHSSSRCAGLSLSRPLLLRSTGSRRAGSVIVAHGPSCSAACGILPDWGSNPCPLHWQADSQPLRHQGSPSYFFLIVLPHRKGFLYERRHVPFWSWKWPGSCRRCQSSWYAAFPSTASCCWRTTSSWTPSTTTNSYTPTCESETPSATARSITTQSTTCHR